MYRRNTPRLIVRPGADRSGRSGALLRVAVGCALVLAVTGGAPSGSSVSLAHESSTSRGEPVIAPAAGGSTHTLMQMNLCLSGFARCYSKVA
jgi:hypothetical protein